MFFNPKKTVASVMGAFVTAINDLETVEREQQAEAARHAEAIVSARSAHDDAIREASMARDVIAKLQSVITPAVPQLGASSLMTEGAAS